MRTVEQTRKRNAAIGAELKQGAKPTALADKYKLSRASVYRIAREAFAAPPATAEAPTRSGASVNLYGERGTSGLRRNGGSIDDDYDRVFRTLRSRMALYREMGDDSIVAAVLQAIKMTLRRVKWSAQTDGATDADAKAAEWLGTCMDDMSQSWTDTIDQAVGCIQYGFYPAELVYKPRRGDKETTITTTGPDGKPEEIVLPPSKYDDGKIGWRKWVFLAPETLAPGNEWVFDDHGGLVGLNQQAPPNWQTVFIPVEKVVNFRTTAERGNPEGRSILRAMYKPWFYKSNLEEVEAISAERMGTGFPVVYLGGDTARTPDQADNDLDTFKDIVRNVRVDEQSGLVIPYAKMGGGAKEGDGVLFEFVTPPGTGAVNFGEVITRHEQRMAMVGLAQFIHLGMAGVGARALGESSQDFFTLAVSAWADAIADTIQRYAVDRLFKLNNFPGLTVVPHIAHEAVAQTDIKMVADYINALAGKELLTPSEELERHLLELADLPANPKLTEIWEAKEKARATALENAATNPPPVAGNDGKPLVADNEDAPPAKDAETELASELRRANELLAESLRAERFAERQPAAPVFNVTMPEIKAEFTVPSAVTVEKAGPNVTVQVNPTPVTIENNVAPAAVTVDNHVAAPDMTPVADALRETPPPVVNNHVSVPAAPAPTVNVTTPPAIVSVDMQPVADAMRDVAQTDETVTIERDAAGLLKSATKKRRKRGG